MNYYPHHLSNFNSETRVSRLPMVYILTTRNFEYIKIGKTKSPKQRFINIQSGCPFELFLWLCIRTPLPAQVEMELHKIMRHCQTRGEWFTPDEADLDALIEFFHMTNASVRDAANALLQA